MGVSVRYVDSGGTDGPFDLASNGAWVKFAEWAETRGDKLKELVTVGEAKDTRALSLQLDEALEDGDPPKVVADVAAELKKTLGVGDASETVFVEM